MKKLKELGKVREIDEILGLVVRFVKNSETKTEESFTDMGEKVVYREFL